MALIDCLKEIESTMMLAVNEGRDIEIRFFEKVEEDPITQCWNWIGSKTFDGYGRFWSKNETILAHRFIYKIKKGKIPKGLTLDHLCRNPSCVNPDHLEPVTQQENVLRGIGITAQNAKKTHCKRGHKLKGDNLYIKPNKDRICRICKNNEQKNRRNQLRNRNMK